MPRNFVENLSTSPSVDMTRPEIVENDSVETLAAGITAAAEVVGGVRDEVALGNLESETANLLNEVGEYKRTQRNLLSALSVSGQDAAVLEGIQEELLRLRNGEVQGKLSPMDAHMKLRVLVNSKMRRYPHLQSEIQKMHTALTEGITRVVTEADRGDPISKAQDAILEEAERKSTTPFLIRQRIQLEERAATAKLNREFAENNGLDMELPLRVEAQATIQKGLFDIYNALMTAHKSGQLVSQTELLRLASFGTTARDQITQSILKMESDARSSGASLQFRPEFRKELMDMVDNEVRGLQAIIPQMDSLDRQQKMLSYLSAKMERENTLKINEMLGWAAPFLSFPGGTEILASIDKFSEQAAQGQLPQIRELARAGSQPAQRFIRLWDSGDIPREVAQDQADILNGQNPTEFGGRDGGEVDMFRKAAAWRVAVDPQVPFETRAAYLKTFINAADGFFSSNYMRALQDDRTVQLIVQSPELIRAVNTRVEQDITTGLSKIQSENSKNRIQYDATKNEFSVPRVSQFAVGGAGPGADSYDREAFEAVRYLNRAIKATSISGEDVPGRVETIFQRLAGARKLASIQDLIADGEAPKTPNNRKGPINRDTRGASGRFSIDPGTQAIVDTKTSRVLRMEDVNKLLQSDLSLEEVASLERAINASVEAP